MASGSNRRKLPTVLSVRMSRALRDAVDATARAHDQSAAAFLRQIAAAQVRVHNHDDSFRSRARTPICIPTPELAALTRLTAQLAKTGGSVVQLCKVFREGRHPAHPAAEDVLADLRRVHQDLIGIVQNLRDEVSK